MNYVVYLSALLTCVFGTGIVSPVNWLSFTNKSPYNIKESHGIYTFFSKKIISPGTNYFESIKYVLLSL